jgi:hypothetical protein
MLKCFTAGYVSVGSVAVIVSVNVTCCNMKHVDMKL